MSRCNIHTEFFCSAYKSSWQLLSYFLYFSIALTSFWLLLFILTMYSSFPFYCSSLIFLSPCCHFMFFISIPLLHILQLQVALCIVTFEMIHRFWWCDTWVTLVIISTLGDLQPCTFLGFGSSSWWEAFLGSWHCCQCLQETLVVLGRSHFAITELSLPQHLFALCSLLWRKGIWETPWRHWASHLQHNWGWLVLFLGPCPPYSASVRSVLRHFESGVLATQHGLRSSNAQQWSLCVSWMSIPATKYRTITPSPSWHTMRSTAYSHGGTAR